MRWTWAWAGSVFMIAGLVSVDARLAGPLEAPLDFRLSPLVTGALLSFAGSEISASG